MTFLEYIRNRPGIRPEHIEILATDISSTVLFLGKLGRYDNLSMSRGLADEYKQRYFETTDNKIWTISQEMARRTSGDRA